MIRKAIELNSKYLVLSTESIDNLENTYNVDGIQLEFKGKTLSKKEFNAFMKQYWYYIKERYNLIIVIGTELFKFMSKVKKAGNYQTERFEYDGVTVIQGHKLDRLYLEKEKYLYDLSLNNINRYFNKQDPVRIWEFIDQKKVNIKEKINNEYEFTKLLNDIKSKNIVIDLETLGVRAENAKIYSISITEVENKNTITFLYEPWMKIQLKEFLKGKHIIFHNALFDLKILITNLFMYDHRDLYGMRDGIIWLKENITIDDTMIMVYNVTNNTQGNELGLKFNALKWTGNYAIDVKDIAKAIDSSSVTPKEILEYNAIDTLATALLYEEYKKKIKEVEMIYTKNIESIYYLIELMIVGLPLSEKKLDRARMELEDARKNVLFKILNYVGDFDFNVSSSKQLSNFIYNQLGLPVVELTKSKQPSTSGDTLKLLAERHTDDKDIKEFLTNVKDFKDIEKILTGFIEPFETYYFRRGETAWLTGNHVLGGTVSGRLSSKEPNLANLPSNSKYGKLIKSIFQAPEGWLFCGSDFSALNISGVLNRNI